MSTPTVFPSLDLPTIVHGSDTRGYHRGCKCAECRAAHTTANGNWAKTDKGLEARRRASAARDARRRELLTDGHTREDVIELRFSQGRFGCTLCGVDLRGKTICVDHVIPVMGDISGWLFEHPGDVIENRELNCVSCSPSKGNRITQRDIYMFIENLWAHQFPERADEQGYLKSD